MSEAYDALKTRILDGRIAQGFQAPEPEIAGLLGMSRTPVREALLRLQSEGLIELIPRRGARVLPISISDMQEIYEILTALEPAAAAKLAANPDRARVCQGLLDAVDVMENALERGDLNGWAKSDDNFHRELLEKQGNGRMRAFVANLYDQAHRARITTLRLRHPPRASTSEHRETLQHILAGDVERARETFRAHRLRAAEEMLTLLRDCRLNAF